MKFNLKLGLFLLFLGLTGCQEKTSQYAKIDGFTMGTTYQITLATKTDQQSTIDLKLLKQQIDHRLDVINQLMSTYIADSELSMFNQSNSTECQPLSKDTLEVINSAIEISEQTKGKFDVTLAPLIEIWGFDKKQTNNQIPSETTIKKLLAQIGYQKVTVKADCAAKQLPDLSVNLSAIAKGYAVDQIADLIKRQGVNHYLVEIGGEIANQGINPKGKNWTLAIESATTEQRSIQKIIYPKGLGVATSGDYRNYFEKDGKRYSHTIDPTTGYPIDHTLASVTVLHPQTMIADALATAMMVMGPELSLDFAERQQLPIFMLVKTENGFQEVFSSTFNSYLN